MYRGFGRRAVNPISKPTVDSPNSPEIAPMVQSLHTHSVIRIDLFTNLSNNTNSVETDRMIPQLT